MRRSEEKCIPSMAVADQLNNFQSDLFSFWITLYGMVTNVTYNIFQSNLFSFLDYSLQWLMKMLILFSIEAGNWWTFCGNHLKESFGYV